MIAFADKLPGTLMAAVRYFDAERSESYIRDIKWPSGPCCPKCGSVNVGEIKSRAKFQCRERGCRKQFSMIQGTIMEGTHIPLEKWVVGVWMIVNCRNGVSSCEIARTLGIKQQSAWHLLHRVRHIMQQDNAEKLGTRGGVVECDSTYVGGLLKFMSAERANRAKMSGRPNGKVEVHAIKERRTGTIRASVVPCDASRFAAEDIMENVERGARIYTDAGAAYRWLDGSWYQHESVNHGAQEYARGTVHVNGCENFFNCLRRGIKGTYVCPSPEHLPAYVDEQVFRFNNRKESDWERFDRVMHRIVGKRLTYSDLTDGATR